MMSFTRLSLLTAVLAPAFLTPAFAEVKVVTSIKPLHSLVSKVMKGVGEPDLLITGAASPHDYALKPSQASLLEQADLVFWISEDIETFLVKPLESLSDKKKTVHLMETPELIKKSFREKLSPENEHKDHDEHEHDEHHGDHKAHDEHKKHEEHAGHEGHSHSSEFDGHIWLDPVNAQHLIKEISARLKQADSENAQLYDTNAKAAINELDELLHEITHQTEKYHDAKFIVFHDAYQYFEERFGLKASGTVTTNLESGTGVQHLKELRHHVEEHNITCLFSEPQFPAKLIQTVQEGTNLKTGVLDPLGANIEPGSALYNKLIKQMATSMTDCFES